MKKYKLTDEFITYQGHKLYRIESLIDFDDVKVGDKGGFIESEANLSQEGNCWLYKSDIHNDVHSPKVFGDAKVYDNAKIYCNPEISGNAYISGNSVVYDNVVIFGHAKLLNNVIVSGTAKIYGNANITDHARIFGNAEIYDNAYISNHAVVCDRATVYDNAFVYNNVAIYDRTKVFGNAIVRGDAIVNGVAQIGGDADISDICDYLTYQLPCEDSIYYVTWTKTDNCWHSHNADETGEEFIQRGYKTSQFLGDWCKAIVEAQEKFAKLSKEK